MARPLKWSAVMNARIDVVKRPATNSLDAVVVAALSARRLLAVAGSVLLVFSLGASVVLVPAAAAESDAKAVGEAPFQSVEGLSLGVEVTVRYALDPDHIAAIARRLPEDVGRDLIEPVVDGVLYRSLSGYTVREIFTSRRAELQKKVEDELRTALARDGVIVRALF